MPVTATGQVRTGGFGEFEMPASVAVDPDGNVWVAEINGNRVQKFDEDGDVLLVLGGNQGCSQRAVRLPAGRRGGL